MSELYSVRQIRALEALAVEKYSIPESVLMERAGKSAWDILQEKWPDAKHFIVFCGNGNNGGDGYILARLAAAQMKKVRVYFVGNLERLKPPARQAYEDCLNSGVKIARWTEYQTGEVDVIVDALFGIGLKGGLEGEFAQVVCLVNQEANEEKCKVLSLDIASGLSADTGCAISGAVKADCTVTFMGVKPGMLMADGPDYSGEVFCARLGLPDSACLAICPEAEVLDFRALKSKYLLPRNRNTHKGHFGHVLVVGGAPGMSGSVRMAGEAALRVGAGLVTVGTHPAHAAWIASQRPEIMSYGIEKPEQLTPLLERATVVVAGMGLGQDDWGKRLFETILKTDKTLLLDADALNFLTEKSPMKKMNWILTPHPGEAGRLLQMKTDAIQQDRLSAVKALQVQWGGVCVLKGSGTLVKGEDGPIGLCTKGNPGMATGGMGDILSGVIGGLLAQHIPIEKAAELGICLHALAGDAAASVKGERGLLAMDLMPYLQLLSR